MLYYCFQEYGLVFVSDATLAESHKTNKKGAKVEKQNSIDRTIKKPVRPHSKMNGAALVSPQAADILQQTEGTLGKPGCGVFLTLICY